MPVLSIAPQVPSNAIIEVKISWSLTSYHFMLDVEDSVYCLQLWIEQELGYPAPLQRLFSDSIQLRGATLIRQIYTGSVISLNLKLMVRLRVRTLKDMSLIDIDAYSDDSIRSLKQRIASETNTPVMDFYLHVGRRRLIQADDYSLESLQWRSNEYLVVVPIDFCISVKSLRTLKQFDMTVTPSTRVTDVIKLARAHFDFSVSDAGALPRDTIIIDRKRFFSDDTMASLGVRGGVVLYCE